ncbi:MarR family transcriptional regulator [Paenibacillus sp. TRM 82003]|uniref:MarR family winged helix-turn-helix transcriptional regulator n=1 Tax=Kineococcus sp. TRM81007 TaxID=2925831 RepID=UPI001F5A0E95|nr:MarR family transcriptional regulator [Kineococcus sp. TRM81007]MCI2238428.1 MarR family transcriptional regulator [Kineococcus sp. TRM81007]MCI3922059.1 MarR family transcriptional regulator [Paenibacillus sp. TRM 82003]
MARDAGRSPGATPPADEVDLIVAAWRRETPQLDVEPLEVLSRVARLARHLDRLRRDAFAAHELETWEFDVLAALRRAGAPHELSPGQLVVQTLVTSGTMTNRVDRLAGRGLVQRRPAPDDGRSVRVRLTAEGAAVVDAALADLVRAEHRMLAVLDERERRSLATLLRRVAAPFERSGAAD